MNSYVKFCPQCRSERPAEEVFCEAEHNGLRCQWPLSNEQLRLPGQPEQLPTETVLAPTQCPAGHPLDAGDQLCLQCGASLPDPDVPGDQATDLQVTEIDGWLVLERLPTTTEAWERFVVSGPQPRALLTLYAAGSEPDAAVYEALRRLDRDHIPEVLATGRWNDRAYDVSEEIVGGCLAGNGNGLADDPTRLRSMVEQLGRALCAFAERGLRHRDLNPENILVRAEQPLDLVVTGFGSARLSDFDLEAVTPLAISRYSSPETIACLNSPASDWWSLGVVLLEQITGGRCFDGINEKALRLHVVTRGMLLPDELEPSIRLLLAGLLARDPSVRWQWTEVESWLEGRPVAAPSLLDWSEAPSGPSLRLSGREYRRPENYALAAAEAGNWEEACDLFLRGSLATWLGEVDAAPQAVAWVRRQQSDEHLDVDLRHSLALMALNPSLPLTLRGEIITPGWLLANPGLGYEIVTGRVSEQLEASGREAWIVQLKHRALAIRERAKILEIELEESRTRVLCLTSSRSNLENERAKLRRIYPDSEHLGIASLMERERLSDEDLILLLSAAHTQFTPLDTLVDEAVALAKDVKARDFSPDHARMLLAGSRKELYAQVDMRTSGFATCPQARVNEWVASYRVERRLSLPKAVVLLALPQEDWTEPPKQQYVAALLEHFEKRVTYEVQRGPLARMVIGKTTPRVDLVELGSAFRTGESLLDHILTRGEAPIGLDPQGLSDEAVHLRLRRLVSHALTFARDTGIDGRYLGFPFLLIRDPNAPTPRAPRLAPVFLWPIAIDSQPGAEGRATLAFDRERDEVRLNPALESLVGTAELEQWKDALRQLLERSSLRTSEVMDILGHLAPAAGRKLVPLPSPTAKPGSKPRTLVCSAVLFNAEFSGQAVVEDLRQLRRMPPAGTTLEHLLRIASETPAGQVQALPPQLRYLTADSDPSQERAVAMARQTPGLLVQGPPGTGKSQTIVNVVCDCIARHESVLIVCQKQAALRVVQKRLEAEGLGDRLMAVVDMVKDREPVIRALRDQLEGLQAKGASGAAARRKRRDEIAARVAALESELDRYHESLYRIDDRTGYCYRDILAHLLDIERSQPLPPIPALRKRLEQAGREELGVLEEFCGPLAPLWLGAKYEGSPLQVLNSFHADDATLELLAQSLRDFAEGEQAREAVLQERPCKLDLPEAGPVRDWLRLHESRFRALQDPERRDLARWIGMFLVDTSNGPAVQALARLRSDCAAIRGLADVSFQHELLERLAQTSDAELAQLVAFGKEAAKPLTFLQRFSIPRILRQRRYHRALAGFGCPETADARTAFARTAALELGLRPLRAAAQEQARRLGVNGWDPMIVLSPRGLLSLAEPLAAQLGVVHQAALAIDACPARQAAEAMAKAGSPEAYEAFRAEMDSALARCDARDASLRRLEALEQWFSPQWMGSVREAIRQNARPVTDLAAIQEALPTAAEFLRFRLRAAQLPREILDTFALLRPAEGVLAGLAPEQLEVAVRRILRREALLAWKARIEPLVPQVLVEPEEIRRKIEALAAADRDLRNANRILLQQDIDSRRTDNAKAWEDITRLKGPRARRLREVIARGRDIGLTELRPVWLMNPDTASRILPLEAHTFDVVVFDEASQMLVEHSVPSLFRARRVVVSGDDKQMPPTSFFSSRPGSDEDAEFEGDGIDEGASEAERVAYEDTWNRREIKDCPDLLALAQSSLPTTTLDVHYRSKYRELIQFSNSAFYGNRLNVPARHPDGEVRRHKPIEVVRVDGLYEGQTNPTEAAKVVEILADLWSNRGGATPSIGVVTFNKKQADLIEDFLAKRCEQDSAFRNAFGRERQRVQDGEDMGFFVKNVENVQGDERDVIVFSTTFGRDERGAFRRLFGVLGQAGGERRLNVAITRAREKNILVTSMPVNEVSDMLATNRPPAKARDFLQAYLDYAAKLGSGMLPEARSAAQRLGVADASTGRSPEPDLFVEQVRAYVESRGYAVVQADDGDAFGVDLAVEDPDSGMFALAIECDPPRDPAAKLGSARARELWRPGILKRAMKGVHRVSSYAWFHSPDAEKKRLDHALKQALDKETA